MRMVFTTLAAVVFAGSAFAADLSGEIKSTVAETSKGDWGATTEFTLGIAAGDVANGSIELKAVPGGDFDVDEWHLGTTINMVGLSFGKQGDVWVGAEGEHSLSIPTMGDSLQANIGAGSLALGFNDVKADVSDLSNIQGSYKIGSGVGSITGAVDYNLNSDNIIVGASLSDFKVGSTGLGGAVTYDTDLELFGYEGVTTLAGATLYANGTDADLLQNLGIGYDHNMSGVTLGTDINYNLDNEDWTPSVHLSFNF
jgi:hypothetical protein